jgi:hypothetical protein
MSEYLRQIREDRKNLSTAMQMYRENFNGDMPDFGVGYFPKTQEIPFYISEIKKAVATKTPIKSKRTGPITTEID